MAFILLCWIIMITTFRQCSCLHQVLLYYTHNELLYSVKIARNWNVFMKYIYICKKVTTYIDCTVLCYIVIITYSQCHPRLSLSLPWHSQCLPRLSLSLPWHSQCHPRLSLSLPWHSQCLPDFPSPLPLLSQPSSLPPYVSLCYDVTEGIPWGFPGM